MRNLINFFRYDNAFIIILGVLFLATGSSFASERVRDTIIGEKLEELGGVDNSAILAADLDSFKQRVSITDVVEDEENYYIIYSFYTIDIKNNAWQDMTKNQKLNVPKEALNGGKDLGLYIQSELAQMMDGQLAYLKDVQKKEQKNGQTKIIKTTKYTGLRGLVLNSETKELEGYESVVRRVERIDPPYVLPAEISQESSIRSFAVEPAPVVEPAPTVEPTPTDTATSTATTDVPMGETSLIDATFADTSTTATTTDTATTTSPSPI